MTTERPVLSDETINYFGGFLRAMRGNPAHGEPGHVCHPQAKRIRDACRTTWGDVFMTALDVLTGAGGLAGLIALGILIF
jgi:hypothetical protein